MPCKLPIRPTSAVNDGWMPPTHSEARAPPGSKMPSLRPCSSRLGEWTGRASGWRSGPMPVMDDYFLCQLGRVHGVCPMLWSTSVLLYCFILCHLCLGYYCLSGGLHHVLFFPSIITPSMLRLFHTYLPSSHTESFSCLLGRLSASKSFFPFSFSCGLHKRLHTEHHVSWYHHHVGERARLRIFRFRAETLRHGPKHIAHCTHDS